MEKNVQNWDRECSAAMLIQYLQYALEEVQMTSPRAAEHLDSAIQTLAGDMEQRRRALAEH